MLAGRFSGLFLLLGSLWGCWCWLGQGLASLFEVHVFDVVGIFKGDKHVL